VDFKGAEPVRFPSVKNIPSFIFLITSEKDEHIIVDTGFDINHIPGPDSSCTRREGQDIQSLLRELDIDPLSIKTVIQTHLHWDHAAGIKFFPNAKIYVQAGEIEGLFSLKEFEETSFAPYHWFDALERFALVNGDLEIKPGIKLLQTGGHTRGHQGVKINCLDNSVVLIGDSPFTYEWLWTLVPPSLWESYRSGAGQKFFWKDEYLDRIRSWYEKNRPREPLLDLYRTVEDLRQSGDIALFAHDPTLKGTETF